MKYFLNTILNVILWVVVSVLLLMVLSGLYQRVFNKNGYTGIAGVAYAVVVSGSMVPVFEVNDLIVYQEHKNNRYEVGDIIVYVRDKGTESEMLITHRIIEKNEDGLVTKGDANSIADKPITWEQVVGKVVFNVHNVGKFVNFLRTPLGIIINAVVLGGLVFLDIVLSVGFRKKKKVRTISGEQYLRY